MHFVHGGAAETLSIRVQRTVTHANMPNHVSKRLLPLCSSSWQVFSSSPFLRSFLTAFRLLPSRSQSRENHRERILPLLHLFIVLVCLVLWSLFLGIRSIGRLW